MGRGRVTSVQSVSDSTLMAGASRTSHKLWFGLLGLIVICFLALLFEAIWIERELNRQVSDRIQQAGYKRVEVETRGRDIVLSGQASSDQAVARLLKLATAVYGVRRADSVMEIKPFRLPHVRMQLDKAGVVHLTGEVPDPMHVQRLIDSIEPDLRESAVVEILIDPETGEPEWIQIAAQFLAMGRKVSDFDLEIGAGQVSLRGETDDLDIYREVMTHSKSLCEENGLYLINRLAQLPEQG